MILQRQRFWLFVAAIIFTAGVTLVWRLRPLFWSKMWHARVDSNGSFSGRARLYRGPQGYVMVYLGPSTDLNVYVVRISRSQVGVTGDYYYWFISQLGALAKGDSDPSINMMHDKYNYADPHLKLGQHWVTFQTVSGETIHAEW
jgi:hypothetical protein